MVPSRPARGPCGAAGSGECRLSWHGWQERKTGPSHPLRVMQCRRHARFFVVYPPGHAPYQRKRLAPVGSDGHRLVGAQSGADGFWCTFFKAALDASRSMPWDRSGTGGSAHWWSTQCRRVFRAMELCGVAPGRSDGIRERISAVLGVGGLLVMEQAGHTEEPYAGYVAHGRAVVSVLSEMGTHRPASRMLLEAGYVAGVWGRPCWWNAKACRLETVALFSGDPRGPPAVAEGPSKEPTTSVH